MARDPPALPSPLGPPGENSPLEQRGLPVSTVRTRVPYPAVLTLGQLWVLPLCPLEALMEPRDAPRDRGCIIQDQAKVGDEMQSAQGRGHCRA